MKIRISSVFCDDLPQRYFQKSIYGIKKGAQLENFMHGSEHNVYAISFADTHYYYVRLEDDAQYVVPYPAELTEIVDRSIPQSWVISHETPAQHRKLPLHQTVICPADWIRPYFSMFLDELQDGEERAVRTFLETAARDYPQGG